MGSQRSAVHHEDPTPSDADGGFVMNFGIEIVEDVDAEVENIMHLDAVGLFAEAREAAALTMEHYLHSFPVLIEFLRLLYDQGDYGALRNNVEKALSSLSPTWDDGQVLMLLLFKDLTFIHPHGYSRDAFRRVRPRVRVIQGLSSTPLEEMNEEQVSTIDT